MATPRGLPDAPLDRQIVEEAPRFDFFQAVRLLERMRPDRASVGGPGPSRREAVRFRAATGLVFPASAIPRLEPPTEPGYPSAMTTAFLGLTG